MFFNKIQFSKKKRKRLGRGSGSGLGKTCGRGHKGQKARSGGFHKIGFEGGQAPLHIRLPKFGFTSYRKKYIKEISIFKLNRLCNDTIVNIEVLKTMRLINKNVQKVKLIVSQKNNKLEKSLTILNIQVSNSALVQILSVGGSIISK